MKLRFQTFFRFVRRHGFSLLEVVALAALGFYIDNHKEQFPWLVTMQSQAQNLMTRLDPVGRRTSHVVVAEIDDATYAARGLSEPTSRHFIASLVRASATADAAVVVLDINLVSDNADVSARRAENADLEASILEAAAKSPSIPVVLSVLLLEHSGGAVELPNIFRDIAIPYAQFQNRNVPERPLVGFVNAPSEPGKLPLLFDAQPSGSATVTPFWSLSLRVTDVYDSVLHIDPPASLDPAIRAATEDGEFVYGTFLPPSAFLHVSANDVASRKPDALALLAHRIVLIGGRRHNKLGAWVDMHDSPLGSMSGVYLHANRIEAILDGRVKRPSPWWFPWVFDITLGVMLVVWSARARTLRAQLLAVGVFAAPVIVAYFLSVNLHYALDFALPLLVLAAHLTLDKYCDYRKSRPHESIEQAA